MGSGAEGLWGGRKMHFDASKGAPSDASFSKLSGAALVEELGSLTKSQVAS